MKKFFITAIFALVGLLAFAQERIAVFPFEDMENVLTRNEAVLFYRQFGNEFSNRSAGRFIVIPRSDVDRLINTEAAFQLSDFSAREKTAEMNRVLNGTQILSGLIGKVGGNIHITVSLYTYPELQQLPGGATRNVSNTIELFNIIPELVQDMQSKIAGGAISTEPSLLEKGISYYNRGDYDRAIFELTDAIKVNPNLAEAFLFRCFSYLSRYQEGDYSKAIEDISQAIRLEPDNAFYYYVRGRRGYNRDTDSRIADLSQAIRLEPNNDLYYAARGNLYYDKGYSDNSYFDRAIADLSQAIRLNPYNSDAYSRRAWAYGEKGDYDRAIADCSRVIELYPDYIDARTCGEAYWSRAYSWERKGYTTQANADYATATEMGFVPKY